MNKTNNIYTIEGVIFAKPTKTVVSKKKSTLGQSFDFPSIILEVKRVNKGTEYTTLPEFELGKGVNIEDFAVKDKVEITFVLDGRKIGDWHKTSAKALYIRHIDVDYNDTKDIGVQKPQREVFVPPSPLDDDEDDGLPF